MDTVAEENKKPTELDGAYRRYWTGTCQEAG